MEAAPASPELSNFSVDRRTHPRYRYSVPITIHLPDGSSAPAITLELSESGLSALVGVPLAVGATVTLEPVGGARAAALIQRNLGKVYGFRFLELSEEQVEQIRNKCKMLPRYRNIAVTV